MRLIDADALPRHGKRGGVVHWKDIENAPTIDAVPVTRCKHCRRWLNGDDTYGTCQWNEYQTLQTRYDDYCSQGERK